MELSYCIRNRSREPKNSKNCSVGVRNFRLNVLSPDNDWPSCLKNFTLFGLKRLINSRILSATPNLTMSFTEESACSVFPLCLGSYGRSPLLRGAWSMSLAVQVTGDWNEGSTVKVYPGHGKKQHRRSPIYWKHSQDSAMLQLNVTTLALNSSSPQALSAQVRDTPECTETEPTQISLLRQHRCLKQVLDNCPTWAAA